MPSFTEMRDRIGYTQSELAMKSGVRQETISRIEKGRKPQARTLKKLAKALKVSESAILEAVAEASKKTANRSISTAWTFLKGLDPDYQKGCLEGLILKWTHGSTGLEGNTLTEGDTQLILSQGLTISGKSLREHQEVHGHAEAIKLMEMWAKQPSNLSIARLHELHRAVQTGIVIDIYAPVGSFKVEANGTQAIQSQGSSVWHEYAEPIHVNKLIKVWLQDLKMTLSSLPSKPNNRDLVKAYSTTHLGFTSIHPYADGNGRIARLLANLPMLESGKPPLTINPKKRKNYMTLMGDYTLARGLVLPDDPLVMEGPEKIALEEFFLDEWKSSLDLLAEFRQRQNKRDSSQ